MILESTNKYDDEVVKNINEIQYKLYSDRIKLSAEMIKTVSPNLKVDVNYKVR